MICFKKQWYLYLKIWHGFWAGRDPHAGSHTKDLTLRYAKQATQLGDWETATQQHYKLNFRILLLKQETTCTRPWWHVPRHNDSTEMDRNGSGLAVLLGCDTILLIAWKMVDTEEDGRAFWSRLDPQDFTLKCSASAIQAVGGFRAASSSSSLRLRFWWRLPF